jgi:hypothetical protein
MTLAALAPSKPEWPVRSRKAGQQFTNQTINWTQLNTVTIPTSSLSYPVNYSFLRNARLSLQPPASLWRRCPSVVLLPALVGRIAFSAGFKSGLFEKLKLNFRPCCSFHRGRGREGWRVPWRDWIGWHALNLNATRPALCPEERRGHALTTALFSWNLVPWQRGMLPMQGLECCHVLGFATAGSPPFCTAPVAATVSGRPLIIGLAEAPDHDPDWNFPSNSQILRTFSRQIPGLSHKLS